MVNESEQQGPTPNEKNRFAYQKQGRAYPLFNILVIALLIINLCLTAVIIADQLKSSESDTHDSQTERTTPLPQELQSSQARNDLFDSLAETYNNKDYRGLYNQFSDLFTVQCSYESFTKTLDTLYDIFGRIENSAYYYYEVQESTNGRKSFVLYYVIECEKMSGKAEITIIQQNDDPYELVGFRLISTTD